MIVMHSRPRKHRVPIVMVCLLMLISACTTTQQQSGGPTAATQSSQAATALPVPDAPTVGPGMFMNPVIDKDFPDPDALRTKDTYYAYATNAPGANIQIARSKDLVRWESLPDALPVLPGWAKPNFTWAPEVTLAADGKTYVMYFVARQSLSGRQCIGVATSDKPEGPFTSTAPIPFVCQLDQGGSIDPDAFVDDDGTHYLVWKNDGNCCKFDTFIYIQKLSPDDQTLVGQPTKLIHEDQAWEGNLVEAPNLWKHAGKYYLFYSANDYAGGQYAVGYAVADSILGPYRKPEGSLLHSSTEHGNVVGPGGEDIVTTPDGATWMLYHSWDSQVKYRGMNIDQLVWEGDKPVVKGPNRIPELAPIPTTP